MSRSNVLLYPVTVLLSMSSLKSSRRYKSNLPHQLQVGEDACTTHTHTHARAPFNRQRTSDHFGRLVSRLAHACLDVWRLNFNCILAENARESWHTTHSNPLRYCASLLHLTFTLKPCIKDALCCPLCVRVVLYQGDHFCAPALVSKLEFIPFNTSSSHIQWFLVLKHRGVKKHTNTHRGWKAAILSPASRCSNHDNRMAGRHCALSKASAGAFFLPK